LLYNEGKTKVGPATLLTVLGAASLIAVAIIRYYNDYGNMFLYREDNSWQHWLHVSKYPPSAAFTFLELGVMSLVMALMMAIERVIGVRPNGVLLVFGQTSMMFYLVHRLLLEGSATHGGLRHFADINTTYIITLLMLIMLYPFCLWYRGYKAKHAQSVWLKYL